MTWLKKIGSILLKGIAIAQGYAPVAQQLIPGASGLIQAVTDDLSAIKQVIVQAEVFGQALNLAGTDKLKAAAPAVSQILLQSRMLAGHKIKDEAKYNDAVARLTGALADIFNALDDDVPSHDKT